MKIGYLSRGVVNMGLLQEDEFRSFIQRFPYNKNFSKCNLHKLGIFFILFQCFFVFF